MSQDTAGSTPREIRPDAGAGQAPPSEAPFSIQLPIQKDSYRMFKLLALFEGLLSLFVEMGRTSARKLIKPALMAACVTGTYAMIHIVEERSLLGGLKAAFLDDDTGRAERQRIQQQALLQAELRQFSMANKLIDQLLQTMLDRASGAARVRLNVIHNGVTGLTGTGLLRYDVTNTATAAGRLPGQGVVNQPLSEWSDFLPVLLSGQCSFHRIADLHAVALRARFESFGAGSVLVCPAADVQGKTVGAVFILWDGPDPVPAGADLKALMVTELHLGAQVAAVLDLQGPPPWPSVSTASE
jgi:hypothetical protein